ncbi:MAG TPA: HDOD domain-containing protein [Anaeromyxobacter sp.]|nr:HDOD domain-containing protein [Anaeromyxobacter sp.]
MLDLIRMAGFFARFFGGKGSRPPGPARPPGRSSGAARPSAGAAPPDGPGGASAGQRPDGDPFASFARALGVESPRAPGDGEAEGAVGPGELDAPEQALAARLLEHFRKNRPGPAAAPSLSLRLLNLVASPRAEVGEMVRLISADPALAAGVLTVANSVAYRGREEIETVRAAVVRLGIAEVGRVAGAVGARSLFHPRLKAELAAHGPRYAGLFHRALTVASGAAALTLQRQGGRSDRAYLGGMLFDVGKSIALRSLAALAAEPGTPPLDGAIVDRVLDRVHVEVGGECHQEWNLPQYLTVIAVRHHDPVVPADAEFAELHAVRLCGALLDLREPFLAARAAGEIVQSARALALDSLAVRAVDAELRSAAQRVASAFGVDPGR